MDRGLGVLRRLLDKAYRFSEGAVVFGLGESKEHFLKKYLVCWELRKAGYPFYVEARFSYNKGRADILTAVDGEAVAVEIVASEGIESLGFKKLKYPCRVVAIKVGKGFDLEEVR